MSRMDRIAITPPYYLRSARQLIGFASRSTFGSASMFWDRVRYRCGLVNPFLWRLRPSLKPRKLASSCLSPSRDYGFPRRFNRAEVALDAPGSLWRLKSTVRNQSRSSRFARFVLLSGFAIAKCLLGYAPRYSFDDTTVLGRDRLQT